ncbi:MAG TPA: hypothetical protein VNJ02_14940 [Vicinamibacterales bacterium]|nr:hypothetical protein [Vicinamibacterales bacterium]
MVTVLAMSDGCGGGKSTPTAPTPTPTATAPATPSRRLQLSGRVLDQNGTPLPGARVGVYYSPGGGTSIPLRCPSVNYCWVATTTNDLGEYSVEFEPGPSAHYGLGFVYSFHDGYNPDFQWVPTSGSPAVRDMRLRLTRSIPAGESIVVSVDATSMLCADLEDIYPGDMRCEMVVIESGAGMLTVEARPAAGGPAPWLLMYAGAGPGRPITWLGPGAVAIPAEGGTYRFLVAVKEGAPSQQIHVATTLR